MNTSNSGKRRAGFWDYNKGGTYFVTFCTFGKICVLGKVENSEIVLSESGKLVKETIHLLTKKYPKVQMESYVIMPNHVHLILSILEGNHITMNPEKEEGKGGFLGSKNTMGQNGLGQIIRYLKGKSTFEIRKSDKKFRWQANYHDHIIRNSEEHNRIKEYVESNPANWSVDRFCR
jgi:REP element-mobilizing transposase RayT